MGSGARVTDIQALRAFRPALIRFSEDAQRAITSPGSDAGRVMSWLQQDRLPYWKREIRIRSEQAVVAKSKLTQQITSESPRPSVDARKAYELAKRRVQEAEEKFSRTRRAVLELQKEIDRYRGTVQPMASIARADMKTAVGRLDGYIKSLEEYARVGQAEANPKQPSVDAAGPAESSEEAE